MVTNKPVAYIADCGTIVSDGDPFFDDYKNPQPIYSQEYVSDLLTQLELEQEKSRRVMSENYQQAGRIAELEEQKEGWVDIAKAVGLKHDELKAKLAMPV
jgi:hypothetical protein